MNAKVWTYVVAGLFGLFLIGVVNAADAITLDSAKQAGMMLAINGNGKYTLDPNGSVATIEFFAFDPKLVQTNKVTASYNKDKGEWLATLSAIKGKWDVYAEMTVIRNMKSSKVKSNTITVEVK